MEHGRRVARRRGSPDSLRSDAASNAVPVRRWRQEPEDRIRDLEAEVARMRAQRDEADARYRHYRQWAELTLGELVEAFRTEVQHLRDRIAACRASLIRRRQDYMDQMREGLGREISTIYQLEGAASRIIRGARVPGYPAPAAPAAAVPAPAAPAPVAPAILSAPAVVHVPPPPPFMGGVRRPDEGPSGAGPSRPVDRPRVRRTARKSSIPPSAVRIAGLAGEAGPVRMISSSSSSTREVTWE